MGPHTIEQFVTRRVASNGVLLAWHGSSVKINEYCNGGQMSYAYAQCLKIIQKISSLAILPNETLKVIFKHCFAAEEN